MPKNIPIKEMTEMLEFTGVTISFKATAQQLHELDEGKAILVKVHSIPLKVQRADLKKEK